MPDATVYDVVSAQQPFGVDLLVSQHLAGSKKAVWDGTRIFVSPAMLSLMRHADDAEFERVCRAIRVIHIPALELSLPMTMTYEPSVYDTINKWLEKPEKTDATLSPLWATK